MGAKSCLSFTTMWSITPKPPTCPSRLQPVHQAKSCLDLLHLDHMTQCHVSFAMSSFIITCVSFATSPSHFYIHGICCSHTCTCGLITCVSHINTISPPRLSLNYQKLTRTFQSWGWLGGGGKAVRTRSDAGVAAVLWGRVPVVMPWVRHILNIVKKYRVSGLCIFFYDGYASTFFGLWIRSL